MALFQAMPRIGSRLSALLVQCLAAPFGALIEWLWLGTVMSGLQLACGAVILAGVAMALKPHLPVSRPHRQVVIGVWFGVLAALGQALGAVGQCEPLKFSLPINGRLRIENKATVDAIAAGGLSQRIDDLTLEREIPTQLEVYQF